MKKFVLVTGGCGYIGSHICVELLEQKRNVVIFDNLSNSKRSLIKKLKKICPDSNIQFVRGDVRDLDALNSAFEVYPIDSVIHLAGVKSVSESIEKPQEYYEINVGGTLNILRVMKQHGVKNLIFSSSATVYGDSRVPDEGLKEISVSPCSEPQNPYGRSKKIAERILQDSGRDRKIAILRYFNPLGAHPSGLIGDRSKDNLMPRLLFAAKYSGVFHVYGDIYSTPDGTPIRDYIHVTDLARGHIKILESVEKDCWKGNTQVFNLGTGKGYTVLEVLKAFQNATGQKLKYDIDEPRQGDVPISFANCEKAKQNGFEATHTLEEMCQKEGSEKMSEEAQTINIITTELSREIERLKRENVQQKKENDQKSLLIAYLQNKESETAPDTTNNEIFEKAIQRERELKERAQKQIEFFRAQSGNLHEQNEFLKEQSQNYRTAIAADAVHFRNIISIVRGTEGNMECLREQLETYISCTGYLDSDEEDSSESSSAEDQRQYYPWMNEQE